MADEHIPNLRGNGLSTVAFIVGPLFGALVVLLGIAWQAAKYPDRSEFELMRNDTTLTKQDVAIMKSQNAGRDAMAARRDAHMIETDGKLDKILDELRRGRR